jgi:hypothetical protein
MRDKALKFIEKIENFKVIPIHLFLYFTIIILIRTLVEVYVLLPGGHSWNIVGTRVLTIFNYFYIPLLAIPFFLSVYLKKELKKVYNIFALAWTVILIPVLHPYLIGEKINMYYLYGSVQEVFFKW